MALLAAYVGVASVWPEWLARLLGTAPDGVYRHWLPVGLGALLCLSILIATIVRIPLRLRHAGAWCSHLGVLVLAAGAAWYAIGSVSGYCVNQLRRVHSGSGSEWIPTGSFYLNDAYAAYVAVDKGEPVQTPLAGLDPDRGTECSFPLAGAPQGVSIRALSCTAGPEPVLDVEIRGELWSSVARVPFVEFLGQDDMTLVSLPDVRAVRLAFSRRRLPLPEPIKILQAVYLTHPGSVVPKDYRCEVRIGSDDGLVLTLDEESVLYSPNESLLVSGDELIPNSSADSRPYRSRRDVRVETISLNRPIRVGPYQLSQGIWWPDATIWADAPVEPRSTTSEAIFEGGSLSAAIIFEVRSRPGLPLILAGLAMIVAGMLFAFYVKPRFPRPRGAA